jgi:hypothetical protein
MSKAAPLSAALVSKGTPAPVSTAPETAPAPPVEAPARPVAAPKLGTIAVTVRLDPDRYERLKQEAARSRRTNQTIIVAALDKYLA